MWGGGSSVGTQIGWRLLEGSQKGVQQGVQQGVQKGAAGEEKRQGGRQRKGERLLGTRVAVTWDSCVGYLGHTPWAESSSL